MVKSWSGSWGRVISELVGSDNPCINGQNILATEVVEYLSARGVPVVRVGVESWSGSWGRVVSELVSSDNPYINGQNILATEVVEYLSARGVPVVRVGVIACI